MRSWNISSRNSEFAHYGVLGMKWGVRHEEKTKSSRQAKIKKSNTKKISEIDRKSTAKAGMRSWSDREKITFDRPERFIEGGKSEAFNRASSDVSRLSRTLSLNFSSPTIYVKSPKSGKTVSATISAGSIHGGGVGYIVKTEDGIYEYEAVDDPDALKKLMEDLINNRDEERAKELEKIEKDWSKTVSDELNKKGSVSSETMKKANARYDIAKAKLNMKDLASTVSSPVKTAINSGKTILDSWFKKKP